MAMRKIIIIILIGLGISLLALHLWQEQIAPIGSDANKIAEIIIDINGKHYKGVQYAPIIVQYAPIIIFLLYGIFLIIIKVILARKNKLLNQRGVLIKATNPTVVMQNRVRAQWTNPSDGKVYEFYSENMKYDPTPYLGDTVNIKILSDNPNVYRFENLPQVKPIVS